MGDVVHVHHQFRALLLAVSLPLGAGTQGHGEHGEALPPVAETIIDHLAYCVGHLDHVIEMLRHLWPPTWKCHTAWGIDRLALNRRDLFGPARKSWPPRGPACCLPGLD